MFARGEDGTIQLLKSCLFHFIHAKVVNNRIKFDMSATGINL